MLRRIKIAILRKMRDLHYYGGKICDDAALKCAVRMTDAYEAGNTKTVDFLRKMYVFYTKAAMKNRSIVGRCNAFIIKNKSA